MRLYEFKKCFEYLFLSDFAEHNFENLDDILNKN